MLQSQSISSGSARAAIAKLGSDQAASCLYSLPSNVSFRNLARQHGIPFRAIATGIISSSSSNTTQPFSSRISTPLCSVSSPNPTPPSPSAISPADSLNSSPYSSKSTSKRPTPLSTEQYSELCRQEEALLEKILINCTHPQSRLPTQFFFNIINMMFNEIGFDIESLIRPDPTKQSNTLKDPKTPISPSSYPIPPNTSPKLTPSDLSAFSQEWMQGFVVRHPELGARICKTVGSSDIDTFDLWFCEYLSGVHSRNIDSANIYNMADTGIYRGVPKNKPSQDSLNPTSQDDPKVVRQGGFAFFQPLKSIRDQYKTYSAHPDSVTTSVIETISADGTTLNPYVIVNQALFVKDSQRIVASNLVERFQTKGWAIASSHDGRVGSEAGYEWLKNHFDPQTRGKANGKPRALLLNGEMQSLSFRFLQFAAEHNIALFFFPPNTSDILQPFSIGPGKYLHTLRPIVQAIEDALHGKPTVDWLAFFDMVAQSRFVILDKTKVQESWATAGLLPFNPQRVVKIKFPNLNSPPLLARQLQIKYQKHANPDPSQSVKQSPGSVTNDDLDEYSKFNSLLASQQKRLSQSSKPTNLGAGSLNPASVANSPANPSNNSPAPSADPNYKPNEIAKIQKATKLLLDKMKSFIPSDANNFAVSYASYLSICNEFAELVEQMQTLHQHTAQSAPLKNNGNPRLTSKEQNILYQALRNHNFPGSLQNLHNVPNAQTLQDVYGLQNGQGTAASSVGQYTQAGATGFNSQSQNQQQIQSSQNAQPFPQDAQLQKRRKLNADKQQKPSYLDMYEGVKMGTANKIDERSIAGSVGDVNTSKSGGNAKGNAPKYDPNQLSASIYNNVNTSRPSASQTQQPSKPGNNDPNSSASQEKRHLYQASNDIYRPGHINNNSKMDNFVMDQLSLLGSDLFDNYGGIKGFKGIIGNIHDDDVSGGGTDVGLNGNHGVGAAKVSINEVTGGNDQNAVSDDNGKNGEAGGSVSRSESNPGSTGATPSAMSNNNQYCNNSPTTANASAKYPKTANKPGEKGPKNFNINSLRNIANNINSINNLSISNMFTMMNSIGGINGLNNVHHIGDLDNLNSMKYSERENLAGASTGNANKNEGSLGSGIVASSPHHRSNSNVNFKPGHNGRNSLRDLVNASHGRNQGTSSNHHNSPILRPASSSDNPGIDKMQMGDNAGNFNNVDVNQLINNMFRTVSLPPTSSSSMATAAALSSGSGASTAGKGPNQVKNSGLGGSRNSPSAGGLGLNHINLSNMNARRVNSMSSVLDNDKNSTFTSGASPGQHGNAVTTSDNFSGSNSAGQNARSHYFNLE